MPFVTVDHFAPLDAPAKRRLQERLAAMVMQTMAAPPTNVRIFLRAFDPADVYVATGAPETGLPLIRVEHLPGRTDDQKRALVRGLAQITAEELGVDVAQIRTILYERARNEWARGDVLVADAP